MPLPPANPAPDATPEWNLALDCVETTGTSLFLTGRAGTGKTTFLHRLRASSPKRIVVAAPTGVAAVNAGGVTLHSFFQLPVGPQDPGGGNEPRFRFSREKIALVRGMDLLVIDEISMVRADLLDAVDAVLRRFRDPGAPFGGVQLLMIGDLRQLPPVAHDAEWALLRDRYETPYFFSSRALAATDYRCIELRHVYRQRDPAFLDLLNAVRDGRPTPSLLAALGSRCDPSFVPSPAEPCITLCTHNAQADAINRARLDALPAAPLRLRAALSGTFPPASYPTESDLLLKEGAQVMFLKNDPEKRFYNGRLGIVVRLAPPDTVFVRCPGDPDDIRVIPMTWQNLRYAADPSTGRITETVEGTFRQFPLRLAWAVTIHKSQGLTFDRAIIQADRAFAPGQVYVALSRCRTLSGLVLTRPVPPSAIRIDPLVDRYLATIESRRPTPETLRADRLAWRRTLLDRLFDFRALSSAAFRLDQLAATDPTALPPSAPAVLSAVFSAASDSLRRPADRFRAVLPRLLETETDPASLSPPLADRLRNAAAYFAPILRNAILDPAASIDPDIDNKTVRAALRRHLDSLQTEARAKLAAFSTLPGGFDARRLLQAAAAARFAAATPARPRKTAAPAPENPGANPHPELVARLRAWRKAKAAETRLLPYQVFSQKTLYALAAELPLDPGALSRVYGFGRVRTDRYADEILPIVRDYCRETGARPLPPGDPPPTLF